MRIIAGAFGGRVLKTVTGPGYRPATSRVREAIFSMLESRGVVWSGIRVLDLFAGSGSLAFEALSRGAAEACLVEKAAAPAECLRRNASSLGLAGDQCRIAQADVLSFLRVRAYQAYDVVFIDPPYGEKKLTPSLSALLRGKWLAQGGFVLAEVEASLSIPASPVKGDNPLLLETDRTYGQTRILLWHMPQNDLQSTPEPLIP